MIKLRWINLLIFCFFPLLLVGKPPELTPHNVRVKIDEILRAHATHHVLNQELVSRSLLNFLHELDPNYCYLIEPEVIAWTKPSEELLSTVLKELKNNQFSIFEEIYALMLKAIDRRRALENEISRDVSAESVDPEEFKNMTWVQTKEALKKRLEHLHQLQIKTVERILDPEEQLQFQKRLDKRRTTHEDELKADTRNYSVLTYVLKAVASSLDSQTSYFTPFEANQLMVQMQQRLFGIGAHLRDDLSGFTIVQILDNSPLSRHPEVLVGDQIIAVNKQPVVGLDITEVVELVRGVEGTSVILTFLRRKENQQDQQFDVQITRGEIVLKESRFESGYEPFGKGVIGILRLNSFYQDSEYSSASDLSQEIEQLKKKHKLEGIILDLRSNTGGLLPQAVSVAGLFMNKGVVVSIKDNTGFIQRLRNLESKATWDGPLIILTNKLSASSSEIVAQSLQEYGRALIVGDPETFGKGTFQTFTLESTSYGKVNSQGEYKVTRGHYYTVSGKTPQKVGVKANIIVPGPLSEMEIGERFSKYPLEADEIPPCFEDDLSDIPILHRYQVSKLYKGQLQPIATTYYPFSPQLVSNSTYRLKNNLNHQNLLKAISSKQPEKTPTLGASDLQLQEAVNIMKDLIFMMHRSQEVGVNI